MIRLLLVCALLIAAVAGVSRTSSLLPRLDGRIVGGRPVEIEDYPYQISFQSYKSHFCGGSLISSDVVLTAAHCTDGKTPDRLSIAYGAKHRYQGNSVDVSQIDQHQSFSWDTFDNDIAVLFLRENVVFGSNAALIPLTSSAPGSSDRVGHVSGWGRLWSGGSSPDLLQAVAVTEVPHNDCNYYYSGKITERMICFAAPGKDSCQGDSGGPLVDKNRNEQVGIVSWGYGCADARYPGVYSNVYILKSWIRRRIAKK
ncbi:hypothetical protein FQA39_LY16115 [Lamprigera yunnana]|nr:hypothetical protein FQA39_LY16115 [Lamprigera yunnana]